MSSGAGDYTSEVSTLGRVVSREMEISFEEEVLLFAKAVNQAVLACQQLNKQVRNQNRANTGDAFLERIKQIFTQIAGMQPEQLNDTIKMKLVSAVARALNTLPNLNPKTFTVLAGLSGGGKPLHPLRLMLDSLERMLSAANECFVNDVYVNQQAVQTLSTDARDELRIAWFHWHRIRGVFITRMQTEVRRPAFMQGNLEERQPSWQQPQAKFATVSA